MQQRVRRRFGIGEWYGQLLANMDFEQRAALARNEQLPKANRQSQPCPFKGGVCTKIGGVCSLRLYQEDANTHMAVPVAGPDGGLVTVCPHRFRQDGLIFRWIGETLLGTNEPQIVGEIGFLEQIEGTDDVGRIDNVLVHPDIGTFRWCALEIQAVYFSGPGMLQEFRALGDATDAALPFPSAIRRPDFRSSGPKRLMPQLQIKVPALRRWGKKMVVVVDRKFFEALGAMDNVPDVSNADIAWFVVDYEEQERRALLRPAFHRLTTLERAVEGLTGGRPVSLETFERRIREKLELRR